MNCLRPFLLLLAFCLALTAPAQAGGWLGAENHTCRHLTADATQATVPDETAQHGTAVVACHVMCAIVDAGVILVGDDGVADGAIIVSSLDLSLRPAGLDRPPKAPILLA